MTRKLIWACAVMGAAVAWAESEVVDGVTWYYGTGQQRDAQTQQNETYAYITSGSVKYTGDLTVPSQLGNWTVTSIGDGAFYGCSGLTRVTFQGAPPSGVSGRGLLSYENVSFPRSSGAAWMKVVGASKFTGYDLEWVWFDLVAPPSCLCPS